MTDEPARDEDDSPAEGRVHALLGELRAAPVPAGASLPGDVVRSARWQRPLRRALAEVGALLGGVADGLGSLLRRPPR